MMKRKTLPNIHLLMALLLSGASMYALSQDAPNTPQAPTDTQEQVEIEATQNDSPTVGNSDKNSNPDYRASEEISQDLSVSFPVDI